MDPFEWHPFKGTSNLIRQWDFPFDPVGTSNLTPRISGIPDIRIFGILEIRKFRWGSEGERRFLSLRISQLMSYYYMWILKALQRLLREYSDDNHCVLLRNFMQKFHSEGPTGFIQQVLNQTDPCG